MSNFKKFVAIGMSMTMIVGGSLTAFAADGDEGSAVTVTGEGATTYTDMEVYSIIVPTAANITAALAYTVDPQGLVAEVEGSTEGGKTVEEGARVLFADTDTTLSSTGAALTITNKSSMGLKLAVEASLVKGDSTYAGGFSSTSDFSGSGDSAKGLYFGLRADNELEKALSDTAVTVTNVALSAAEYYKVSKSGSTYTYALPTDTSEIEFPTYCLRVTGALNEDVADTTWYSKSGTTKTALTMPTLTVKYTPDGIRDVKHARILLDGDDFYVGKYDSTDSDGGFGETKPASITINGKAYPTGVTIADNDSGFVKVPWEAVWKTWGLTSLENVSDEDQQAIYDSVKSIVVTFGSGDTAVSYYAEVPTE